MNPFIAISSFGEKEPSASERGQHVAYSPGAKSSSPASLPTANVHLLFYFCGRSDSSKAQSGGPGWPASQLLVKLALLYLHCLFLSFFPDPYTTYKFWLKAFTWKNEGQPSSPPYEVTTDVRMPEAPIVTNLACKDASSLYVEWENNPTGPGMNLSFSRICDNTL